MKVTYKCQADLSEDVLKVASTFDEDHHLYFQSSDKWAYPISVYLSRKQVKKLRKQLKKALET